MASLNSFSASSYRFESIKRTPRLLWASANSEFNVIASLYSFSASSYFSNLYNKAPKLL